MEQRAQLRADRQRRAPRPPSLRGGATVRIQKHPRRSPTRVSWGWRDILSRRETASRPPRRCSGRNPIRVFRLTCRSGSISSAGVVCWAKPNHGFWHCQQRERKTFVDVVVAPRSPASIRDRRTPRRHASPPQQAMREKRNMRFPPRFTRFSAYGMHHTRPRRAAASARAATANAWRTSFGRASSSTPRGRLRAMRFHRTAQTATAGGTHSGERKACAARSADAPNIACGGRKKTGRWMRPVSCFGNRSSGVDVPQWSSFSSSSA